MRELAERRGAGGPLVVLSGGGTGGHLYPALALAEALEARRPDVRTFFVGASRGIEARVLPERGVDHVLLPVRGVARGELLSNLSVAPAAGQSVWQVWRLFRRLRPALVVVTGGYAGAPAGVVAVVRRIPLALQEQNSVPGITTRMLARWARQIHVAFPEAAERLPTAAAPRAVHSGNPVAPPGEVDAGEARRHFGLARSGPVVLVIGGSQGSAALNRLVAEAVREIEAGRVERGPDVQLLWSTGPAHLEWVRNAVGEKVPDWVVCVDYIHRMDLALGVADIAVSRAGAMATSELLAWGVPMILVPLPTAAADHQTQNARTLETAGAAIHCPERGLDGTGLWASVAELTSDPERLAAFRHAALGRARPEAASRIAAALESLLPPEKGGEG